MKEKNNKGFLNFLRQNRRFRVMLYLLTFATVMALLARCSEVYQERSTGLIRSASALPEFNTEEAGMIEFRFGAMAPVRLILKDGSWVVQADGKPEVYANAGKIAELISDLKQARLLREILIQDEEAAASLALSDYRADRTVQPGQYSYGAEVRIYGKNKEKLLLDMMLGNAHYKPVEIIADNYSMQSPDGRYIRINEKGKKSCYLISRVFAECIPMSGLWVEQLRMNTLDVPLSLQYKSVKGEKNVIWQVDLTGEDSYGLTVPSGKMIDLHSIDRKLKLLAGAFTRDIAGKNVEFQPDTVLTLVLANGFTYTLEMQDDPAQEMRRFARLNIAYDENAVRSKPGETAENLAKRKKYLQQKAEVEKKWFGGKIFILQPNVINIVKEIPQT